MNAESYVELGSTLRNARLDHKLELPEIARLLYIRPRYLEALEAGAFESLPGGPTYVKGYLLQYAKFLGLPEQDIAADYERLGALPARRMFYIPDTLGREEHPSYWLVGITLVLALALGFYLYHSPSSAPREITPPPASAKPAAGKQEYEVKLPECFDATQPAWPPCYYKQEQPETSPLLPDVTRGRTP